ncbi:MAG: hybrid sensor histidine kinase/response regulator [Deltaproteobacteria bacterium]|nr:MAG: hybrid sensor histidine kinase/response regulator [Deltaproteobacteria bacterium]
MKAGDQQYQQLFQIFQEECKEHIQMLNDGLLALERQPNGGPSEDILRSAHSLKGASRMMGFKTIETLSHYLETLLTQLIRGEKQASPPIMDALYRDVDAVSRALNALERGDEPESVDEVLKQIQMIAEEKSSSEPSPTNRPSEGKEATQVIAEAPKPSVKREESGGLTTIRVQTDKLDSLMNQVGELLVSKIEALENLRQMEETLELLGEVRKKLTRDTKQGPLLNRLDALGEELYNPLLGLSESTHRLERLVDEIHEGVKDLRLLPLSTILEPFPRMVRDLGRDLGKDVELILEGASTRLDKKILEELREPLIHLVRNSIDHGVEPPKERAQRGKPGKGKILIAARQEGGRVLISVSDDGRGLGRQEIEKTAVQRGIASTEEISRWQDEELWELIFRAGFSTAQNVTEVSGRGVGLDAVLARIEHLKGSLSTESRLDKGVTFTLSLPLTLSTAHALLFRTGGDVYCLPADALEKTLLLSPDQISSVEGKSTVVIEGVPLAFAWMAEILNLPKESENGTIPALLLRTQRGRAVLGVEALLGEEEIVVKGLGKLLSQVPHVSGGTILGKGQIALILNPNDLVRSLAHQGVARHSPTPSLSPSSPPRQKRVLVAEDSLTTRTLEKNILEAAGFDVTTAVDGEDALIKLYEKSFDIVISDIQMPRMDGFGLIERLKKESRFKDIPVILVTSLQTEADKKRGIEAGADAYITKGTFDQKHLLDIIQRFV